MYHRQLRQPYEHLHLHRWQWLGSSMTWDASEVRWNWSAMQANRIDFWVILPKNHSLHYWKWCQFVCPFFQYRSCWGISGCWLSWCLQLVFGMFQILLRINGWCYGDRVTIWSENWDMWCSFICDHSKITAIMFRIAWCSGIINLLTNCIRKFGRQHFTYQLMIVDYQIFYF